ncbi:hypothetical protein DMUE_0567 [Dictyocoela muelleri]|nr:hypothetical protein DMUE_0567 [Dictyocoela muelleri]
MDSKEAYIQIFMICKSRAFENWAPNDQSLHIVEQADSFIPRLLFEKGRLNKLPISLEAFIVELKAFIAGKRIDDIIRFINESCSEYLERLKIYSDNLDLEESVIMNKLRTTRAPKVLECIFFSINDFSSVLNRVKNMKI